MIETIYIDSDIEQHAFLVSRLGEGSTWQSVSQIMKSTPTGGIQEILELERSSGERVSFAFEEAMPDSSLGGEGFDRTSAIDDLMERVGGYAAVNPPHHPGSLPRFPIPIRGYGQSVAVPMPILAVDDQGKPGLFSPPRYVVVSWPDAEFVGVGEFPDFDPERWPPARIGEWPPVRLSGMSPEVLLGMIGRFSACWSRVIDAWFAEPVTPGPVLIADAREAVQLRAALEVPGFVRIVNQLNPAFATWLDGLTQDAGDNV